MDDASSELTPGSDAEYDKVVGEGLAAASKVVASRDESVRTSFANASRRFRRFLIGGAAGGLLVSVTMAAALASRGEAAVVPWPLTAAIFFFILALLSGGWLVYGERSEIAEEATRAVLLALAEKMQRTKVSYGEVAAQKIRDDLKAVHDKPSRLPKTLELALMAFVILGFGTGFIVLLNLTALP